MKVFQDKQKEALAANTFSYLHFNWISNELSNDNQQEFLFSHLRTVFFFQAQPYDVKRDVARQLPSVPKHPPYIAARLRNNLHME